MGWVEERRTEVDEEGYGVCVLSNASYRQVYDRDVDLMKGTEQRLTDKTNKGRVKVISHKCINEVR